MAEKRLYDSVRWRKAAKMFLRSHPLCALCERSGRTTRATIIDHIEPHKEDAKLFWSQDNWQALCASCHSGTKRTAETRGYSQAAGKDGLPLDVNHPWNKK